MRILYGPLVLYDRDAGVDLLDVELVLDLREASTLKFKMPRTHPARGAIALESVEPQIEVWDGPTCLMQGRAYACEDADDVGTVEYSCEGELAYLNDTSVRPYSTVAGAAPALAPSDPYGYFAWLIDNHNAKVEPSKRFRVGVNQGHMLDGNGHILRSDSTYPTTGKVIKEKLLESLGGFIRARYEDGARYVDYLADTDGTASQRIEFGANLLRFARTRDGSPIYSAVIPLGAKPEGSDERATIEPLGDGDADQYGRYQKRADALVSVDLVAKVGYRETAVEWDDVTEPENLLARGLAWLPAQANEIETIKLTAYDMSRIDPDAKPFALGDYVRATAAPHGYDSYMIVSRIVMRPTDEAGHEYTFGLDGDDIGDVVRKHAQALNAGINDVYEKAESVDKIAKDAQERADAAKGAADEAQAGADAAKEAADKAKSDAEKAAADAIKAALDALDAKREADEATAKIEVAETDLRVVKEAVASAQGAADAAGEAAGDAEAKADEANKAAAAAKGESQSALESAASAAATAEAAQSEAAGAKADVEKVRTDLAGQIKTVTDTMAADYSKKTDLTQTEARLASEIERSAAGIASTVAETYAKKTDLTSVEADLQTRIEQNADAITSTAKSVTAVDAKANDAASEASAASAAASKAQADAAEAAADAASAQTAADDAAANLAIAEKNLDAVATRVGATEEDVKAAEAAVATAKGAADAASAAAAAAKTDAAAAQATADTAKTAAEAARKAADALGTRVTAAETKIEQNADAITLRATKTEAQGYASTAKSEAVSAAAGDATAKANKAKADAAADAKAKADAALSGAKTYSDAQLKVQADKISANVTETNGLKTRMSTVEQTASGLSVSLNTVDATAKAAQTTANAARTEAANAAKTATSYMEYSSAGLDVGNKSSGKWAGFRTRMAAGAFQVLNSAGTVLASYGDKIVELGKNATDAVISMCGGKGTVSYGTQSGTLIDATEELTVGAARVALRGVGRAVLQSHCKDYDSGGHSASTACVKTAANAGASPSPSVSIRVAKNSNVGADGTTTSASTVSSNLSVTPDGATFDKPFKASSVTVGTCPLTGDATWLYAPGVAAAKFCTQQSSYYPVYGAKIVYSNVSAGTSGTVTINETSANFVYLEIFFRTNDGERNSTRVYQPNGKVANLTSARITSTDGRGWVKSKQVQISGTSIAYVGYAGESAMGMADGGGTNYVGGTLIYLVVGYR